MALVIMATKVDNSVSVIHPVIYPGETEAEAVARVQATDIPAGSVVVEVIDDATLPSRRFRNAWRRQAGALAVDLVEARAIRREELKQERDRLRAESAKLKPLAEAAGDTATAYVAEQNNRDLHVLDDATIQASVNGVNDPTALDTHEPAAITTAKNRTLPTAEELAAALRVLALSLFSAGQGTIPKLLRVIADVIKDENNLVRTRLRAQDTVIENATTLANLKSGWAAMALANPVPNRTLRQLKTAIETRMNSGTLDDGVV